MTTYVFVFVHIIMILFALGSWLWWGLWYNAAYAVATGKQEAAKKEADTKKKADYKEKKKFAKTKKSTNKAATNLREFVKLTSS
jgi:biopolymer transport protein ExbB/TolQ